MTAANRYLHDVYLPRHNQQFMVKAEVETSAFVPTAGFNIADVLCIHEERVVGQDNCVHYRTMKLQIPSSPLRHHYVKMHVRVLHYPDDTLAIFHGPRKIGRYQADGSSLKEPEEQKRAA